MPSRNPIILINAQLGTTTSGTSYTTPGTNPAAPETPAQVVTINSAVVNNSFSSMATLTVYIVPPAGTENGGTEFLSAVQIPPAPSMPTALSALVGQHLRPGYKISAKSGTGLALNIAISGYISTP